VEGWRHRFTMGEEAQRPGGEPRNGSFDRTGGGGLALS
jgi:hypothetical protein